MNTQTPARIARFRLAPGQPHPVENQPHQGSALRNRGMSRLMKIAATCTVLTGLGGMATAVPLQYEKQTRELEQSRDGNYPAQPQLEQEGPLSHNKRQPVQSVPYPETQPTPAPPATTTEVPYPAAQPTAPTYQPKPIAEPVRITHVPAIQPKTPAPSSATAVSEAATTPQPQGPFETERECRRALRTISNPDMVCAKGVRINAKADEGDLENDVTYAPLSLDVVRTYDFKPLSDATFVEFDLKGDRVFPTEWDCNTALNHYVATGKLHLPLKCKPRDVYVNGPDDGRVWLLKGAYTLKQLSPAYAGGEQRLLRDPCTYSMEGCIIYQRGGRDLVPYQPYRRSWMARRAYHLEHRDDHRARGRHERRAEPRRQVEKKKHHIGTSIDRPTKRRTFPPNIDRRGGSRSHGHHHR